MEKNRDNIKEEYGERLLQIAIELRTMSRHINCISMLRVLVVVVGIAAVIYLEGVEAKGLAVIATLALFAGLVVVHGRLYIKSAYKTITARLCLEEVSALQNDFTTFMTGTNGGTQRTATARIWMCLARTLSFSASTARVADRERRG